jgi:hypothetical protein
MQAKEIIGLLNNQVSFDNGTSSRLSSVLDEYPYFQTARLLYTLNLQANKDTRITTEIRKTACYLGDRKKFFYLIEKDFFTLSLLDAERKNENADPLTSFDLINLFLEKKEKNREKESLSTPDSSDSHLVSNDYMSYFLSEETQGQELDAKPMLHQDAIDKFISEDETTGVKIVLKNQRESKEEISVPEVEKEIGNHYLSETLAKIYLKQKKYERALEIIIKLNLIYPEKSIYFADQIRFLEKLVINKKK